MVPSESFREFVAEAIKELKGTPRRILMARVADEIGGQRQAAEAFGWGRDTIRKGTEPASGDSEPDDPPAGEPLP